MLPLIILHMYSAWPQITEPPQNSIVEVNNDYTNVQFKCIAEGAMSYYWERRVGDIPFSANVVTDSDMESSILIIQSLKPPDDGQYRCVAVNEHGTNHSDYAMLSIVGKDRRVLTINECITYRIYHML